MKNKIITVLWGLAYVFLCTFFIQNGFKHPVFYSTYGGVMALILALLTWPKYEEASSYRQEQLVKLAYKWQIISDSRKDADAKSFERLFETDTHVYAKCSKQLIELIESIGANEEKEKKDVSDNNVIMNSVINGGGH